MKSKHNGPYLTDIFMQSNFELQLYMGFNVVFYVLCKLHQWKIHGHICIL